VQPKLSSARAHRVSVLIPTWVVGPGMSIRHSSISLLFFFSFLFLISDFFWLMQEAAAGGAPRGLGATGRRGAARWPRWMRFTFSSSFVTSLHRFLTLLICIYVILDIYLWFFMYSCDYLVVHVNLDVDVWLWVNELFWICVIANRWLLIEKEKEEGNVQATTVDGGGRGTFVPGLNTIWYKFHICTGWDTRHKP
jgi:hypothetical protein